MRLEDVVAARPGDGYCRTARRGGRFFCASAAGRFLGRSLADCRGLGQKDSVPLRASDSRPWPGRHGPTPVPQVFPGHAIERGVLIPLAPKQPTSAYPWSSVRMMTTFGFCAGAWELAPHVEAFPPTIAKQTVTSTPAGTDEGLVRYMVRFRVLLRGPCGGDSPRNRACADCRRSSSIVIRPARTRDFSAADVSELDGDSFSRAA